MRCLVIFQCLVALLGQTLSQFTDNGYCYQGEFLSREIRGNDVVDICLPCPAGQFSPLNYHRNFDCAHCSRPQNYLHEVTLRNCTPYMDTVIGCETGYFRQIYRILGGFRLSGECQACSSCEARNMYTAEPCQQFIDTVCVPSGARVTCQKGQYLSTGARGQDICLDCPSGTFGPYNDHRSTDCALCSTASAHEYERILQECTPTTDTVIGCQVGYYRQSRRIGYRFYGECYRCSNCSSLNMFQVASCDTFSDTVCSTQSNPFKCNEGQYVGINSTNNNICLPCPEGTFQPLNNHSYVTCAICSAARTVNREITLRQCTRTSDTQIGCEQGYFREPRHPPILFVLYEECRRCSLCQGPNYNIKRRCEGYDDTVCCPNDLAAIASNPRCAEI